MGVLPNIFHVCLPRKFQQASQSNVQAYKHNLAKIETGLNRLPVALEPLEVHKFGPATHATVHSNARPSF